MSVVPLTNERWGFASTCGAREPMTWAAIAIVGQWAVTHTTATTFDRPIKVGSTYRVEAPTDADTEYFRA